jgi:hypothetical protein
LDVFKEEFFFLETTPGLETFGLGFHEDAVLLFTFVAIGTF